MTKNAIINIRDAVKGVFGEKYTALNANFRKDKLKSNELNILLQVCYSIQQHLPM